MGSVAPKKARAAAGEKGPSRGASSVSIPHPCSGKSHQPQDTGLFVNPERSLHNIKASLRLLCAQRNKTPKEKS